MADTFGFMDGSKYDITGKQLAAPTSTPTPTPPVTRYTYPTPITPAPAPTSYNGSPILSKPNGPAPVNENQIREETRKRMQSSIDAINAQYVNLIGQEQVAGQDRSGQTRAVNARSGLIGSDFGQAQQQKTTDFNKQQIKSIEDEKTAK